MSKVSINLDEMTAKRIGVVNTKYARKQVQDFLKRMNIYGSTVWYEETKDDVMHFKITNPFLEIAKWLQINRS